MIQPQIRPVEPDNVDVLHRFIVELAEAERFPDPVSAQPKDVAQALFGRVRWPKPWWRRSTGNPLASHGAGEHGEEPLDLVGRSPARLCW
jgi:hypothetical protein